MATILIAHSDPAQREALANGLRARGFDVVATADVDAALDAAGTASPLAFLVEPALLLREDMAVSTRLELRAEKSVRILALTHKFVPAENDAFKRHGAGILAKPMEDVDRLVTMLRASIVDAPWEGESEEPEKTSTRSEPALSKAERKKLEKQKREDEKRKAREERELGKAREEEERLRERAAELERKAREREEREGRERAEKEARERERQERERDRQERGGAEQAVQARLRQERE